MNVRVKHKDFYENIGPAQIEIKGKALTETTEAGVILQYSNSITSFSPFFTNSFFYCALSPPS